LKFIFDRTDGPHELTSELACGTTIVVEQAEGGSNLMISATFEAVSIVFACFLVFPVMENSMSVLGVDGTSRTLQT
jgi:hypothetical protein